jgi:hypothetical protein
VAATRSTGEVVELEWQLGFGFEPKLVLGDMGRWTQAYIGEWDDSGWIKIRIRDKIRVWLKNENPAKSRD